MKYIRHSIVPLLLVCAFLFTGCVQSATTDVTVAKVDDQIITRKDFRIAFNQETLNLLAGALETENPTETIQDQVFSMLIGQAVIKSKFDDYDITVTAEEEAGIQQAVQELITSAEASAREDATEEGAANIDARTAELQQAELQKNGFEDLAEYEAYSAERLRYSLMEAKLRAQIVQDISLTEAEAKQLFEKDLVTQKLDFSKEPAQYESALYAYTSGSTKIPPLFTPSGMGYIKPLMVSDEELANTLYARLQAGEEFDALLNEYGEDPDMKEEPYKTEGFLFYYDDNYAAEFRNAVFSLQEEGAYTEPVKSENGYNIIQLVKFVESHALAWEDVQAFYAEERLPALQSAAFSEQVTAWYKQANIESYISRIRDIGVSS